MTGLLRAVIVVQLALEFGSIQLAAECCSSQMSWDLSIIALTHLADVNFANPLVLTDLNLSFLWMERVVWAPSSWTLQSQFCSQLPLRQRAKNRSL